MLGLYLPTLLFILARTKKDEEDNDFICLTHPYMLDTGQGSWLEVGARYILINGLMDGEMDR